MNTPVKCAKSTALGKKCNPNRDPTKHRKELSIEKDKKALSGSEKD